MTLHPEVQEFARILRKIEALLRANDAAFWADNISLCLNSIEKSDAYGLKRFISMFGGMGSLNDLVLQKDGVLLVTENDDLRSLLSRAWETGTRFQREMR